MADDEVLVRLKYFMKKLFFVFTIAFLSLASESSACSFCNYYSGLDTGSGKNTVGIRGQYHYATYGIPENSFIKLTHGGSDNSSGIPVYEWQADFARFDLHARVYPLPGLQVIATLPFHMNTLTFLNQQESESALGDMTVIGMYQLFNTMTTDSGAVRHRLFAGGGVKLPTGKSEGAAEINIPMSHYLYSGTGSTDYLVSVTYVGKYRKLGWNADLSYKFNGESANDYQYGNTFNAVPRLFYEWNLKSVKLLPHLGGVVEWGDGDTYLDKTVEETGGNLLWGSAGLDFYFGSFSLTSEVRVPVVHELGASLSEDKLCLIGSFNYHF